MITTNPTHVWRKTSGSTEYLESCARTLTTRACDIQCILEIFFPSRSQSEEGRMSIKKREKSHIVELEDGSTWRWARRDRSNMAVDAVQPDCRFRNRQPVVHTRPR